MPVQAKVPMGDMLRRLLAASNRPLGAYELARGIAKRTGRSAYPNTVYRAIVPLVDRGEAIPVACVNGWIWCRASGDGPVLLLLCRDCKHVTQHRLKRIDQELGLYCGTYRFTPTRLHLEVIGTCQDCAMRRSPTA